MYSCILELHIYILIITIIYDDKYIYIYILAGYRNQTWLENPCELSRGGHYRHGNGHLPAARGAKGGAWNRLSGRCSHGARSGSWLEDDDLI